MEEELSIDEWFPDPHYDDNTTIKLEPIIEYNNDQNDVNYCDNTEMILNVNDTAKISKRKRTINVENWKKNIRKQKRQSGQDYIDQAGKLRPKKILKEPCTAVCEHKCTRNFSMEERNNIFQTFWQLNDEHKNYFYEKFIMKTKIRRKTVKYQKKFFTYNYFFQKADRIQRVCKKFFLNTLNISERRIYYFFKHKIDVRTGLPISPTKGKHTKHKIKDKIIQEIKENIMAFPCVESHYDCREYSKNQKYLDPSLNIRKMYDMFKETYNGLPPKESCYRKVFAEHFNLSFHVPTKEDIMCDQCATETKIDDSTPASGANRIVHIENKEIAKENRDIDRNNIDSTTAVICYDLQPQVFSLPIAEISNFYYKRKFNVYTLIGHCNLNKTAYCSFWTELNSSGTRSGNDDIANGLLKILENVVKDNSLVTKIILWSDSCVTQNKNEINSTCILHFLKCHPNISQIEHKYSEPGHSLIQEVDSVHSVIEKHLRGIIQKYFAIFSLEIYSIVFFFF